MAFCVNCGHELAEGAKFCANCGRPVGGSTKAEQRKSSYAGEIHRCPNCGEVLNAFVTTCPSCGYELRSSNVTSRVNELAIKLEQAKSTEQKDDLIRNFYIPNTKEDICEFFILAVSNIKAEDDCEDAWRAKLEQAYQKARLSFRNDSSFLEISKLYESVTKREKLNRFLKKKYAVSIISLLSGLVLCTIGEFPLLYGLQPIGGVLLLIVSPVSAIITLIKDISGKSDNKRQNGKK